MQAIEVATRTATFPEDLSRQRGGTNPASPAQLNCRVQACRGHVVPAMRFAVVREKPAIEAGWWLTHAIVGMQGKLLASHYRLESQLRTGLRFTEYELRNKEDCMIIDDLKFKAEGYYGQKS